ncbi:nucleoside hydrolase [Erysipelothrix sp. HDW6C]|uniref:nucleoside hydrolase n=1 Tax=Erysipelothrix sp. HDW6C TaxID=2714930 RepID=UPI00140D456F|nr:nucleoside hydrolase [Erysipelothrix sp. HDW6C]QIK69634.1 nucleoside hydrolase [Erysipelothrix sp. HDW6C]
MEKKTIIIDCDPGVDDTFALFYAMAERNLNIKLITTVSGNVNVDITTTNARRIVAMANRDIEIAQGADRPLVAEPFYATYIHGQNGMGNYTFTEDVFAPLSERRAVDAMRDVIMTSESKIVLVAVGPLTNVATLFLMYPETKNRIEYLSIMGGGLKGGNTNIAAEFNILVDPEAASIVFTSGVPIIMAGLDVTEKSYIDKTHLERIAQTSEIGYFLSEVIVAARRQMSNDFRTSLHDVVSVMAIHNLEIFEYETLHVVIETQGMYTRGMTIADQRLAGRESGNVKVLKNVNHPAFLDLLCEKLETYRK